MSPHTLTADELVEHVRDLVAQGPANGDRLAATVETNGRRNTTASCGRSFYAPSTPARASILKGHSKALTERCNRASLSND